MMHFGRLCVFVYFIMCLFVTKNICGNKIHGTIIFLVTWMFKNITLF